MPLTAETPQKPRTPILAITTASVLLLAFAVGGIWSVSQVAMVPSSVPAYMAVDGTEDRSSLSSNTHAPQLRLSSAGPIWREITEAQRQILMPLRDRWSSMGALTKRRWLVLADRYPHMDETERHKLVSRMNTWASLSGQQRNQARINFESAKRLSAQELQSKWDEYQALSDAEKQRLTEQARKTRAARKSKRRLAIPTPKTDSLQVETHPVETPQAAPALQLPPLNYKALPPAASSQPVAIPQSMPRVDLPPLPLENTDAP